MKLLLIVFVCFSLFACGGNSDSGLESRPATAEEIEALQGLDKAAFKSN